MIVFCFKKGTKNKLKYKQQEVPNLFTNFSKGEWRILPKDLTSQLHWSTGSSSQKHLMATLVGLFTLLFIYYRGHLKTFQQYITCLVVIAKVLY